MTLISNSGFLSPAVSRGHGKANRHKCVPNMERADFPSVLESGHTQSVTHYASRGGRFEGPARGVASGLSADHFLLIGLTEKRRRVKLERYANEI